jgi:hypothetical protein
MFYYLTADTHRQYADNKFFFAWATLPRQKHHAFSLGLCGLARQITFLAACRPGVPILLVFFDQFGYFDAKMIF